MSFIIRMVWFCALVANLAAGFIVLSTFVGLAGLAGGGDKVAGGIAVMGGSFALIYAVVLSLVPTCFAFAFEQTCRNRIP